MNTNNKQIHWENVPTGFKQGQQSREGDWVCVQCNNLNFSFRKKCNRCKLQSRQENQLQIRQAYQYYEDYYRHINSLESQQVETLAPIVNKQFVTQKNSSLGSQLAIRNHLQYDYDGQQLPSVSPYIKRYKCMDGKIKTQISQGWSSDEQGSVESKGQYLSEYCWRNILVQDFSSEGESQSSGDSQNIDDFSQIQRLVQNIVL